MTLPVLKIDQWLPSHQKKINDGDQYDIVVGEIQREIPDTNFHSVDNDVVVDEMCKI